METIVSRGITYDLKFIKEPDCAEDIEFVRSWASTVFSQYSTAYNDPFIIRIGEYHTDRQTYGWLAEIRSVNFKTQDPTLESPGQPTLIQGEQYYFAHQRNEPSRNYSGRIEIGVAVSSRRIISKCTCERIAQTLSHLAFMNYYTEIARMFPDWTTSYIDSPTYKTDILKKIDSLDHIWD